jgi:MFS family permease
MSSSPLPNRIPNPWWIPRFLGPIPEGIQERHLHVLGFVAFAMLFENYDLGLIGAALPQIAADFQLDDVAKGYFMSAIDFGALPSFLLLPLADRLGRRRLLLVSVIGMSIGSALTAFSPDAGVFAIFQIITRSFAVTASVVSFVIIAEEFPANHRGWGIGMLGAVGAVGFGLGIVGSMTTSFPSKMRMCIS